jgi:GDPmannose 4,6-dehydratase
MKKALLTGISGQDGSYLAEFLLEKGYQVYGIQRRTSTITTTRIDHMLESGKIETYYGDLADANSIVRLLMKVKPDEVYNIGSQSHVRISFDIPEYTAQVTGIAPLRIMEALRTLDMKEVKFYQASSSEMFGISPPPQNENTPMLPQSPYGCAKLMAYHLTRAYRKGYGMFACNGILFNHESERRSINFVTQKICHEAAKIKLGLKNEIRLGNLDAKRDWGHSKDYVRAIWMIMQHSVPDDFVISTQHQYSVKEFAEVVFKKLGLDFYDYVKFDEQYLRPNEVSSLLGDSTKARTVLGWKPEINFEQLVDMMVSKAMEEEEINIYRMQHSYSRSDRSGY